MVALRFSQLYIKKAWEKFPELTNKCFPNFSADKITLSGASTNWTNGKYEVIKPINAFLIGKITQSIGDVSLDVDSIFSEAIEEIFEKALGHRNALHYIKRETYSVSLAGTDHNPSFYNPKNTKELLKIIEQESVANDTVYVVAYAPLSTTEKLSIWLDNITASEEFKNKFPQIGSDIKAMIRRRGPSLDVTMCLPVFPELVRNISDYEEVVDLATQYLYKQINQFVKNKDASIKKVKLMTNTKDTKDKKYFAVWGTALSKGDIGAVGRGNRHQGFISGIRPSTNEAVPGKNPNHFAGIIYQLVAEEIANRIYQELKIRNVVYITVNNGDSLNNPNSIDILVEKIDAKSNREMSEIVNNTLNNIDKLKLDFIMGDVYQKFMNPKIY